jgi:hypothetical protein
VLFCAFALVSRSCPSLSQASQAGAPVQVWVKGTNQPGARYAEVENVDLQQTVSKFIARWVSEEKLHVDASRVTLRLVKCGARKPTAEEEAQAEVLDDPRLSLAAACVTDGCNLLAYVTTSALSLPPLVFALWLADLSPCSGSPLPDTSVAVRDRALRELDVAVQQMRQYKAALAKAFDPKLEAPCYVTMPPHPSLWCSVRHRVQLQAGAATFMCRHGSRALADWLLRLLADSLGAPVQVRVALEQRRLQLALLGYTTRAVLAYLEPPAAAACCCRRRRRFCCCCCRRRL